MSDNPQTAYDDGFDWGDAVGGGFLDDYAGVVTDVEFGVNPQYNEGQVAQMFWEVTLTRVDDPDIELAPGDTVSINFNVGPVDDWEASADGKSIARTDGKAPRPHESSGMGRLLGAIAKNKSIGDSNATEIGNLGALKEILVQRGSGMKAKTWLGLEFDFQRLTFGFTNRDTKEKVEYAREYPVNFIGVNDKVEAGTADKAADPAANGTVTREELVEFAKDKDSFKAFLAQVMATYPGVESGPHGEDVIDENGIYAEAHA